MVGNHGKLSFQNADCKWIQTFAILLMTFYLFIRRTYILSSEYHDCIALVPFFSFPDDFSL